VKAVSAQSIDTQVSRHPENPGGRGRLGGVELFRFAPDLNHGLLHQVLGRRVVSAEAKHVTFDAGREVAEQTLEGLSVAGTADCLQPADELAGERLVFLVCGGTW
jgi:hypothetical protein